ncbi:MAG: hypothetical protein A2V70_11045 [Planctomycetes bacterium RBG_13_63_9]|nr:MAG: hypothetical protein A2V70_11045 [Planctomycetes bacterium RBG_13_63_9]
MPRAVALFSGGLDSMLAVRLMQEQGFLVDALNVRTIYSCCHSTAARAAAALGLRLTVVPVGDDYLEVIRNPLYGYGRGVNPCVDCRIHMCRMAGRFMAEVDACVVITGEIVGQRPMSQRKHQLEIIARRSGLGDRLLRPLSAKLLPPTEVELEGLVDRRKLCGFNGRSRRHLMELARRLGVVAIPSPSTGCALTEPLFARRVRDLMQLHPQAVRWDFELLSHGRHFRFDRLTKVVIGRSLEDNASLRQFAAREDAPRTTLLAPDNFRGPDALVVGRASGPALGYAGTLVLRYAGRDDPSGLWLQVTRPGRQRLIPVPTDEAARSATTL